MAKQPKSSGKSGDSSLIDGDFIGSDDFDDSNIGADALERVTSPMFEVDTGSDKSSQRSNDTDPDDDSLTFSFDDDNPDGAPVTKSKKGDGKKDKDDDLEVDVVSDVPAEDRGKWVAKDDDDLDDPDDEEIKKYSEDVQKRIKKITARSHAERRAKDQLDRQLKEATRIIENLAKQNDEMSSVIESGEKALVSEHKGRLESQLNAAKQLYREAHEAGDTNGLIAAQEQIAKVSASLDRLSTHRPQPLPRVNQDEIKRALTSTPADAGQPDERVKAWQERNKWFGHDDMMTAAALGVHAHLVNREGIRPTDPEYFQRIDAEMHKRFPEKFGGTNSQNNGQQRRRQSVVAGAERSSHSGPTRVTLTESQINLARRLNITPQQYAKQLVLEQKRSGKNLI